MLKYFKKFIHFFIKTFVAPIIKLLPARVIGVLIDASSIIKKNKFGVFYKVFGDLSAIRFTSAYKAEKLMIDFIDNYMNSRACFWDIGACLGTFSSITIKKRIKTVVFEANPYNVSALYENLKINALKSNFKEVYIFPVAVDTKLRLFSLPENHYIGNAISVDKSKNNNAKLFCIGLPIQTILKNTTIPKPTHIKIDVDGNEISVLKSLSSILLSSKLQFVHIEISDNFTQINKLLNSSYLFQIKKDGENYIYKKGTKRGLATIKNIKKN